MNETPTPEFDRLTQHLNEVQHLLSRHRLVENLVNRQEMPKHGLVENLVHKQNLAELRNLLDGLTAVDVAHILEALSPEDRLIAWSEVREERLDAILDKIKQSGYESLSPEEKEFLYHASRK